MRQENRIRTLPEPGQIEMLNFISNSSMARRDDSFFQGVSEIILILYSFMWYRYGQSGV